MTVRSSALKAATRRLIEACGGQESAALIPGIRVTRQQSFSEFGNSSNLDRFISVDVVAMMEADCRQPLITAELAKATGHVLVPLPAVALTRNPLGRITAQAMRDTSEVFAQLGQALDDGTLSEAEAGRIDTRIDEAIVRLLALKAQVDAEAGRDVL